MQKKELQAVIDVKINKEDVFELLVAEREQELEAQIELLETEIEELKEKEEEVIDDINKKILDGQPKGTEFYHHKRRTIFHDSLKNETFYNVERLGDYKDPWKYRNHPAIKWEKTVKVKCSITEYLDLTLDYELDGFKGTLSKRLEIDAKEYTGLVSKYSKLINKRLELEYQLNKYQYELVLLPHNRTIKSQFLKKVLKKDDVKALLG